MLKLYSNQCLSCTDKYTWKKIQTYADSKGLKIQDLRTNYSLEYREQSKVYQQEQNVTEPFIVINGRAINAKDIS